VDKLCSFLHIFTGRLTLVNRVSEGHQHGARPSESEATDVELPRTERPL
jgi:hypothetical protein